MQDTSHLANHSIRLAVGCALLVAASTVSVHANAGCAPALPGAPRLQAHSPGMAVGFLKAVYLDAEKAATLVRVKSDHEAASAGIVGTWRFTWLSDGSAYPVAIPAGAVVDFGTQQWHDDGTEFIISGSRPPGSGDTCMGSWERIGQSTYRLKHIALAWANTDSVPPATPAVYLGPAIIRSTVTLNQAQNAFAGTFTLDQYAKDEITLLEHISGNVTANRFSVD